MRNYLELLIQKLRLQVQVLQLRIKIMLLGSKGGFDDFALALRKRESGNHYLAKNVYGYLGAYQFGMARLSDLGYTERIPGMSGYNNSAFRWKIGYSEFWFLNSFEVQDRIFREHIRGLISKIKLKLSLYLEEQINGTKITLSGLVAGAHLGGIGGVRNYLQGYYDSKDQFGTKVSDYIKEFANYDLSNV